MESYSKEEVNELLSALKEDILDNLKLDSNTTEYYTGGMDDSGSLYSSCTTVTLLYDDKVISSIDIN